jgi:putative sterol carrier protein
MAFTKAQDAFDAMIENFDPAAAQGLEAVFQWEVLGEGGGKWHIVVQNGRAELHDGKHVSPNVSQMSNIDLFLGMVNFEVNPMQAFMSGKLKVTGDMMMAQKILEIFPL